MYDQLFEVNTPLGPATTPDDFQKIENKSTFFAFYDQGNFLSSEVLDNHPSSILGRRGSGKTAVLYHLSFNGGYTVVAKMESNKSFTTVCAEIEDRLGGAGSAGASLVENSAQIWRTLILTTLICQIYDDFKNDSRFFESTQVEDIKRFLKANGILNIRLYHRIWRMITSAFESYAKLNYNVDGKSEPFTEFVDGYFREECEFDQAWNSAVGLLRASNSKAIVLIDSLEQFPIHRPDMQVALSGLLHFIGQLDREFTPARICICFPAELHEDLVSASANPEKDFERVITLHWDVGELFRMAGKRLDLSRRVVHRDFGDVSDLTEEPSRQEIWDYWHQFLPEKVTNRYGRVEDTIPYISRHTQLLPRHLLEVLNRIFMLGVKGRNAPYQITEEEVVEGVRLGEWAVCVGVVDGFKQKYPIAIEVLKLILPDLPNQFTFEKLKRVNRDKGFGVEKDPAVILEMFIRMGIFGRYDHSTEYYDHYRFDYTFNGQMQYSYDGKFGIHPAFSGQYKQLPRPSEGTKPVYPIESFTGKRPGVGRIAGT